MLSRLMKAVSTPAHDGRAPEGLDRWAPTAGPFAAGRRLAPVATLAAMLAATGAGLALGMAPRAGWGSPALAEGDALRPFAVRAGAMDTPLQAVPAASAGAREVFAPVLNFQGGDDVCRAWIAVQNVGAEPTKGVLVAFMEAGQCPPADQGINKTECTGLIMPGGTWDLLGAQIPTGAFGGVVYSFTPRRLSEIGAAAGGADDVTADHLCAMLSATGRGVAGRYAEFAAALRAGEVFEGVDLGQVAGAPIAVQVIRHCPGDRTPGVEVGSSYTGRPLASLGAQSAGQGFEYAISGIHAADSGADSFVYLQNAGLACASVEMWFAPAGTCDQRVRCGAGRGIAPGETGVLPADACTGPSQRGTLWITSDQPLAVVTDTVDRDAMLTHAAVAMAPPGADSDPVAGAARRLLAPVVYVDPASEAPVRPVAGNVAVFVTNHSRVDPALVRVSLRDASGVVIAAEIGTVCAGGTEVFGGPTTQRADGATVGSIVVESERNPESPAIEPPPVSAVAEVRQRNANAPADVLQASSINLQPAPVGSAVPPASGVGPGHALLAVPLVADDLNGTGLATELVIANAIDAPGQTDVVVLVYDQNALVSSRCRVLGPGAVAYLDTRAVHGVASGFKGGALVSATAWSHTTEIRPGVAQAVVGLLAASVVRSGTVAGEDIPGDEVGVTAAVPLPAEAWRGFEGMRVAVPLCPAGALPTRAPGAPVNVPAAALAAEVHLPVVNFVAQDEVCVATIEVTNRGTVPGKAVLVATGEPWFCPPDCNGPLYIECSGLIQPGGTWRLSGNSGLAGTSSATVFSLSASTLGDLGIRPGSSDVAANAICAALEDGANTNEAAARCTDYRRFLTAFQHGGRYGGLPLGLTYGPPIEVSVSRDCQVPPSRSRPGSPPFTVGYTGIPHGDSVAPAPGSDPSRSRFTYNISQVLGDFESEVSVIYIENAGLMCGSITLHFDGIGLGGAPEASVCTVYSIAAGDTYPFDATDCVGPSWRGTAVLASDQPLAVVVEALSTIDGRVLRAHGVEPGSRPFDFDGDGDVDRDDVARLDAAMGARPGSPAWDRRLDLNHDGVIDQADRDWLAQFVDEQILGPSPTPAATRGPEVTPTPNAFRFSKLYLPFVDLGRR